MRVQSSATTSPKHAKPSFRVGLTGGIASGKSTVGKLMGDLGCTVTDADQLVAELYRPGEEGARAVAEQFGPELLDADGAVDKERLAEHVFSDPSSRQQLEHLIHPLVSKRFAALSQENSGLVVFEATLLVETGGYRAFDRLVTVEADADLRLRRAVARGLEPEAARARMSAQADEATRVAAADYVIRNDGTLEELAAATREVVDSLNEDAASVAE